VLRGEDHVRLGRISALAEGVAALALSRGGAVKPYAYVDPNEDCAGFVLGPSGSLVVVGDAHKGCAASHVAVDALLEHFAEAWTGAAALASAWPELAAAAVSQVHMEVLRSGASPVGNPDSRTTFSFCLVRPDDDLLAWASVGDSHVFLAAAESVQEVAVGRDAPSWFVGSAQREPQQLAERVRAGSTSPAGKRAVVLATDGLSEKNIGVEDPASTVADAVRRAADAAPELRPLEAARGVVERSLGAHRRQRAGDNVAIAVIWLG
jgi:serine/threonine protein phosphatase PrpC